MILNKYLIRETLIPFFSVSLVLFSIFLAFILARLLSMASAELIQPSDVFRMAMLKLLISTEILVPVSFYLAIMIGFGRLYSDSEIFVMQSGGMSARQLIQPILVLAFVLALMVGLFSNYARPWIFTEYYKIKAIAETMVDSDRVQQSQFYQFDDSGRTVYIDTIDDLGINLSGIFIHSGTQDEIKVITSPSGYIVKNSRPEYDKLVLKDASIVLKSKGDSDVIASLEYLAVWLPSRNPDPVGRKSKAMDTKDLIKSDKGEDIGELQWRQSMAISVLLLALLAAPLSKSKPRQSRFARMLIAIVLYILYYILLSVSRTEVRQELAMSMWWVPGLLSLLIVTLYVPWVGLWHKLFRQA